MRTPKSDEEKEQAIETGRRLRELRKSAKLSLQEIADRLNSEYGANTNKGMISKYENGIHEPAVGTLFCLARILGVSVDYILGRTDDITGTSISYEPGGMGSVVNVYSRVNPTDGKIAPCGIELIPREWLVGGRDFFGLRIEGGRLAPRYYDGDIVLFERRGKIARDRVALVSVGEEDAFLCYIVKKREGKLIRPLDPAHREEYFTTAELAEIPVHIIGAAVQVRRMESDIL